MYNFQILLIQVLPYLSLLFGLLIGSFLNVCIYRLPLGRTKGLASLEEDSDHDSISATSSASGASLEATPTVSKDKDEVAIRFFFPRRSICPDCNKTLTCWMNIPLLSWLYLRGRCHYCQGKISWRYPLVELLSSFFCVLSFTTFPPLTALIVFAFCAAMIVISFIDLEYYIIPNVITFPGMLIAIILAAINQFQEFVNFPLVRLESAGWGLLVGGGFLWLVSALYKLARRKEGLGFGDVKLMAMVGLLFGPQAAIIAIFTGSTLGTVIGIIYILLAKSNFSRPLPFGPFLALGSILYLFISPMLNESILPIFIL